MRFGDPLEHSYLGYAVRGFFENGGKMCHVEPLDRKKPHAIAVREALEDSAKVEEADSVCAPDLTLDASGAVVPPDVAVHLQAMLLHAGPSRQENRRFTILDSLHGLDAEGERQHCRQLLEAIRSAGGAPEDFSGAALYYPWISVPALVPFDEQAGAGERVETVLVPPCGHVAGIYARTDHAAGVRKAPANEIVNGVLDVETALTDEAQAGFFSARDIPSGAVNCLRAFPGRGIRVWGARTLSSDPDWRYVNVRRLFLQAIRWIEHEMVRMAFEPNGPDLWARIRRELNAYCFDLFRGGALQGATMNEAFFVRCVEETNPPESRDSGAVVAEIGLAAARPHEFIVIRLVHRTGGTTVGGAGAASY